jgi:hypothetical protein
LWLKQLVRAAGLEPALPCEKRILSPLRLPLRHARTLNRPLIGGELRLDKHYEIA